MPLAVISKTEPFAVAPGTPKALTNRLEQLLPAVQAQLVKLEPPTPHQRPRCTTSSNGRRSGRWIGRSG